MESKSNDGLKKCKYCDEPCTGNVHLWTHSESAYFGFEMPSIDNEANNLSGFDDINLIGIKLVPIWFLSLTLLHLVVWFLSFEPVS